VSEGPLHILLVEDQPADAKLVELALQSEPAGQFRLSRASRVSEAVERLGRGDVGMVLTDLGLPDSQGADGVARLRRAAPAVPIVVLSGVEDLERIRASFEAGAVAFEVKRVFPRGYLGPLLERSVVRQRVVRALADPAWRPSEPLPGWEAVREPGLLLVDGRPVAWTPPALAFFDAADQSPPRLPDRLTRALGGAAAGSSASPRLPAGVQVGEVRLRTAGGGGLTVRFTAQTITAGSEQRTILWMTATGLPSEGPPVGADVAPVPGPRPREPALDPASWSRLREMAEGNDRFLPEIVDAFVPFGLGLVADLRGAANSNDRGGLERAAHALKSTSSQVGAATLADLCGRLEAGVRGGTIGDPTEPVAAIDAELQRVVAALRSALPEGTDPSA
jgi:CheY-like chemotaxis protein